MSPNAPFPTARYRRDPFAVAALLVALVALVFSMGGEAPAQRKAGARHKQSGKSLGRKLGALKVGCPISNAVNLGSWCLESTPHQVPVANTGTNNYFYAAQTCVREGGWLPTAAQLIGAAAKAPLNSTIDDDPGSANVTEFPNPSEGIKDKREMSSDLFTTTAGSEAAGSEGVTVGSRGNGSQQEPDPVPMPANPAPTTLDYVTVYDNHNAGGFAGGAPVGRAEPFRCAYAKGFQGHPRESRTG